MPACLLHACLSGSNNTTTLHVRRVVLLLSFLSKTTTDTFAAVATSLVLLDVELEASQYMHDYCA